MSNAPSNQSSISSTATAHMDWDVSWQTEKGRSDWIEPETFVLETIPMLQELGVKQVLDLGCGVGRHALALAKAGFNVAAVDASPTAISHVLSEAKKSGVVIHTKQAEMTAIPLENESLDYVLAWNVIYHGNLSVVLRSIAEIVRVLKPGGLFQGTMLSKRNSEIANGTPVDWNTFVNDSRFEKRHPHFYSDAMELLSLFKGFEPIVLRDAEHRRPGSYHWHLLAEKKVKSP